MLSSIFYIGLMQVMDVSRFTQRVAQDGLL
jgi:hypothetical protein